MPSTAQRKKRRQSAITERHLREDAEARNLVLETQIKALTERPPAPRPGISTHWDWRCGCGRLVYAGRRNCDICGCSRAYSGTTVTGSVRGVLQTSQAASTAIVRQQRVPGLPPATYVAAAARAPPVVQPVQEQRKQQPTPQQPQQHPRTVAGPARGTRSQAAAPAAKPAVAGTSGEQQDTPLPANQLLNAENEEQDDGDDQTTFEDADADPKVLRFRHINLCRKLESKQKQLEKQHDAIEEQRNEMALQQAKLVELQAIADGTIEKIKELQDQSAAIAMQIARIEEERKQGRETAVISAPAQGSPLEAQAAECLAKAAAALQGFQAQSPQVQLLLQQFITFVDQLRAGESSAAADDPKQTTLQQAFANASVSLPGGSAGPEKALQQQAGPPVPTSVPCFDISGSQPAEEQPKASSSEDAAPMAVVGECPGDKRKSDCLLDSGPADTGKKSPADKPTAGEAAQQLGTPMALPLAAVPQFEPQSRDELLVSLALRNKQQCADRKARTEAQHQKSCPY